MLHELSSSSNRLTLLSAAISITAILLFLWKALRPARRLKGVPVIGYDGSQASLEAAKSRFITNAGDVLTEGYQKTGGGFFYAPAVDCERLIIPAKYTEELKNATDDRVDFLGSFREMFEGDYTTIGKRWHLHPRIVKNSLNPKLSSILPPVDEEIIHGFQTILPPCDDWTPVKIAGVFKQMIARASNRMMGGTALSRNDRWIKTSLDFTTDTFMAAQRLKKFPVWLRPIAQWFIPEMKAVWRHQRVAQEVIKPLLMQRQRDVEEKVQSKPEDLLQMLQDGANGTDKSPEFLAYTALAVSFAAVHTSASVPAHLVYDLCARPEYVAPLREEVEAMLKEEGGKFTKAGLARLVKMDSFMKESQRFNPLVFLTFGRVIHSDLTLHDGVVIPAGTVIGVASHAITHDPAFYADPSKFDGFRFVPPEQTDEGASLPPSFVTTNASNLSWGYGKHACSGRFFATFEIKMIMSYLLLNYDFKFAAEGTGRPKNMSFELQNAPDPNVEILLRRRKCSVAKL